MKYKRTELVQLLRTEIERREKSAAEKTADQAITHALERQAHLERYSAHWQRSTARINAAVEAQIPVTKDMLDPELLETQYNRINWWDKSDPKPVTPYVGDLQVLVRMLQLTTDEEVSSTELQRLGFKVPNLFSNAQ